MTRTPRKKRAAKNDPGALATTRAEGAADRRRAVDEAMRWSEALAEAPVPAELPPEWEETFRRAYAARLVERGLAVPAIRKGRSGASGKSSKPRVEFHVDENERQLWSDRADREGLSLSAAIRRVMGDWARSKN